ncbi:DUF3126 domain-containing protein, partial [Brucella melitensis]
MPGAINRLQINVRRIRLKPEELKKLDAYFKRTFNNPDL